MCSKHSIEDHFKYFYCFLDDTFTDVNWTFKPHYADQYTLEHLLYSQIKEAIADEMLDFNEHVWEVESAKRAMEDKDSKRVRTRWVICTKRRQNGV